MRSCSVAMVYTFASLAESCTVAVKANPPTNPASPERLRGDPCLPVVNENVVEHVGHATLGISDPKASSVTIVPFHRSNAHRGHAPCIP
jgi:hypothetical protein